MVVLRLIRRRGLDCREFDVGAHACPNRRHCYACDDHRRCRLGPFRFHVGRYDNYWLRLGPQSQEAA